MSPSQPQLLMPEDLNRKLVSAGYPTGAVSNSLAPKLPLLDGTLSFDTLPSGLSVHCSDVQEKRKASVTVPLDACISINILLEGELYFSLGSQQYRVTSSHEKPLIFINILSQGEVFTRHLLEDQKVKKVNVTLSAQSLLNRCRDDKERARLQSLFNQTSQVRCYPAHSEWLAWADSILASHHKPDFSSTLNTEQVALQVACAGIALVLENAPWQGADAEACQSCPSCAMQDDLAEQAKQLLDNSKEFMSLAALSAQLYCSVSTLQRKFKQQFEMTVSEYQRHHRLSLACDAILLEGVSLGEAAYRAGYQHVENFITAFKKKYRVSPSQLKKQHRHG